MAAKLAAFVGPMVGQTKKAPHLAGHEGFGSYNVEPFGSQGPTYVMLMTVARHDQGHAQCGTERHRNAILGAKVGRPLRGRSGAAPTLCARIKHRGPSTWIGQPCAAINLNFEPTGLLYISLGSFFSPIAMALTRLAPSLSGCACGQKARCYQSRCRILTSRFRSYGNITRHFGPASGHPIAAARWLGWLVETPLPAEKNERKRARLRS
jgi:hypothetical protein